MLLRGPQASIELHIEGYQFPEGQRHYEDANWLVIAGAVEASADTWRFRDPALMTSEVESLAVWFDDVAVDRHPRRQKLGFLEPLLTFRQIRPESLDLRLTLSHEAVPLAASNEEVLLELSPLREELEAAAKDLRSDLARFPTRGTEEFAVDPGDAARGLDEWRSFVVEAMQWLAADPHAQLKALPDTSFLVDEMVLTFAIHVDQTHRLATACNRPLFEGGAARDVDRLLELVSTLPRNGTTGLWSAPALSHAAEWNRVRAAARSVLTTLGEPRRDAALRDLSAVGKSHWGVD